MAFRKGWDIPTNADWIENWTWWDLDPVTEQKVQAKNLTGWTGKMQFRSRHGSATVLAEVSTDNGRMVLGAGEGNISVTLPRAVLLTLKPGQVVCDCLLTDPLGETHPLLEAEPNLLPHVTE